MKLAKMLLLVVMFTFSLTSCAMNKGDVKPDYGEPSTAKAEGEVFYSLHDGMIIAVDKGGQRLPLKKIKLPFKHDIKAIKSIKTITILRLEGSDLELICGPYYCYYY